MAMLMETTKRYEAIEFEEKTINVCNSWFVRIPIGMG